MYFLDESNDINNMKMLKGLALQDILTQVHLYVHRSEYFLSIIFLWDHVLLLSKILSYTFTLLADFGCCAVHYIEMSHFEKKKFFKIK